MVAEVEQAAGLGFGGEVAGVKTFEVEQAADFRGIKGQNIGQLVGDFLAFKRLVVNKSKGVGGNIQRLSDLANGLGLGVPTDLGIEEKVAQAKGFELGKGEAWVVFAGDGMEDAALVEGFQGLADTLAELNGAVL